MKKTFIMLSAVAALSVGALQATEYNYDITPMVGGVMPEGNLGLEDHLFYGLRVGKNIGDYFFNKVELGFDYSPSVKYEGSKEKADIYRPTFNLLKEIPMSKYFTFYGLAGFGIEHLHKSNAVNKTRPYINYGAGLKYFLSDALSLRAEVRHGIKLNNENEATHHYAQHNLFYSLGLTYAFGEIAQAAPAAPVVAPVIAPKPAPVKEVVKEVVIGDDDGDGVLNNVDECPDTPKGVPVDENGCAKTISLHVNFNFDKANILPKYDAEINKVADFMVKYPVYKVMLEGYTDDTGPEKYNETLSDKRAQSVAKALENKGVEADRISTAGYGESKPVATNKTKQGRAENRRVDAVFSY